MYESIKLNLDKATNASKKYYDQKAHKREISIKDLILFINNKKHNKILPDFIDPFIVTDVNNIANNMIIIEALDTGPTGAEQGISRLKPFIPHPAKDTFITEDHGS
uniref:Uncharacterized protein n=1 Tax=Romanomermis culicivorax TaxID=13658 RepID=A0A915HMI4_ROMCU